MEFFLDMPVRKNMDGTEEKGGSKNSPEKLGLGSMFLSWELQELS